MTTQDSAKKVILAAPRGYCAGVDRAIVTVERALERFGAPVYVRKQIVHNKHVVEDLEKRGAIFVDELDEVPANSLVVFSAHGVSPAVKAQAAQRELRTIDATCPLVTKVHREAERFDRKDLQILLIGHAGHEEVEGTMGHAPERTTLVQSPEQAETLELDPAANYAWLSQTTLSVDETMETVNRLRHRLPLLQDPPSDDICYATQNRQQAVKQIAPRVDLMIIVGSANSSNTMRLVDVALEAGAKAAYRVDNYSEINEAWLDGVNTVGLSSGASVPDRLVEGVEAFLQERGFPAAQQERLTEENLRFSLPKELRNDTPQGAEKH